MTIKVLEWLDDNFTPGEYFKYQGKKCIHSDYEFRNWQDEFTVAKFGRFTYAIGDSSKVLNDIAFDAEIEDDETGEIIIGDKQVSKEHATVLYDQSQYYLADLGSVNSTFVKVPERLVLREGIVFDLWKDHLFVVHQIVTTKEYETIVPLNLNHIDPYAFFVDGKLIRKEFQGLNRKRNDYLNNEPGYTHVERLELRYLDHNKGSIFGINPGETISITQTNTSIAPKITIGRGLSSNIRIIGDESISRDHCFITKNEFGDWVLDANNHDVFWSIRLESEWPEVRFDFDEEFGDKDYEEYKRQNREPSTPIFLCDGLQMRISNTLFEYEFIYFMFQLTSNR